MPTRIQLFLLFLRLGLSSFGGPIAHLGYFRRAFVERRDWLTDEEYADLVALCQFLPGPASSQVGMAIGYRFHGVPGALLAWLGFTLPSAIVMLAAGYLLIGHPHWAQSGVVQGLKIAAVAIVLQAVLSMWRSLCTTSARKVIAIAVATLMLMFPTPVAQLAVLASFALLGWLSANRRGEPETWTMEPVDHSRSDFPFLQLFVALLILLTTLGSQLQELPVQIADGFYRTGALVFGGGHVVLPLLQHVTEGWIDSDRFLAGYGLAQALPGPLFALAAYLGVAAGGKLWVGVLALIAIFLPSFLLVCGALPYWQRLRRNARMRNALNVVNAAVVGLLIAAWINPVVSSGVPGAAHAVVAVFAFLLLQWRRMPPIIVVALCALVGRQFLGA